MENINIDPVREMQHLQAMYWHYKKLYRKVMFLCCSEERKDRQSKKRDEYKQKIQRVIELNDVKIFNLFFRIYICIFIKSC